MSSIIKDIDKLQPVMQRGYRELIKRWNESQIPESRTYGIGVAETLRTLERQKELKAQGLSQTLDSNHLKGLAFDIYLYKRSEPTKTNYDTYPLTFLGNIWMEMGGEWGGSWKDFVDMPHFEYTKGDKMPWEENMSLEERVKQLEMDNKALIENVKELKDKVFAVVSNEVPNFAKDPLTWAKLNGITDGTRPNDKVTRAELWTMLYRYNELTEVAK